MLIRRLHRLVSADDRAAHRWADARVAAREMGARTIVRARLVIAGSFEKRFVVGTHIDREAFVLRGGSAIIGPDGRYTV